MKDSKINKPRLNILMIGRFYWPHVGGNENQARLLSEALKKNFPINITFVTSRHEKKLKSKDNLNDIKIVRLPHFISSNYVKYGKTGFILKLINKFLFLLEEYSFQLSIYKFLRKEIKSYDLIHVHQTSWLAIIPSYMGKKNGKPVLVKEATLNGFKFLSSVLLPQYIKKTVIKYATFIAVSEMINNNLIEQGIDSKKIYKIPNGIVLENDCNKNLYEHNHKILFVGNFSHGKIKGLDILINAMKFVVLHVPDVKLEVIGDGNQKHFQDFIKTNNLQNNIYFIGKREHSNNLYKQTNVFVLPSRSEGMSNSLLEAMSLGIPCVATRVSGVEDLIDNGENGFIVEPENVEEMANNIIEIINNQSLAKQIGILAKKKITNKFDINIVCKEYSNLYNSF